MSDVQEPPGLRAMFRIYEHLPGFLPQLAQSIDTNGKARNDEAIEQLIESAIGVAVANLPSSMSISGACDLILGQIRTQLDTFYCHVPTLFEHVNNFAVVVKDSPSEAGLEIYRSMGERLSERCYGRWVGSTHPNLQRTSTLDPIMRRGWSFYTDRSSDGNQSRIEATTHPTHCTLDRFLNLPFDFFHEHLSHVHSGKMKSEYGWPTEFSEGWMLYCAKVFYQSQLFSAWAEWGLWHPAARHASLEEWITNVQRIDGHGVGRWGYAVARSVHGTLLSRLRDVTTANELFTKLTIKFAVEPFDLAERQGVLDIHEVMIVGIDRVMSTLVEEPLEAFVKRLTLWNKLLDGRDPLVAFLSELGMTS